MFRRLLALLAICAGLAAAAEPARASVSAVESVRLVEQAVHASGFVAPAELISASPGDLRRQSSPLGRFDLADMVTAPAVLVQEDRAHE